MRLVRAGTVAALAVLIAGCSKTRAPEQPAQAENDCGRCHGYPPPPFVTAGSDTRTHPANPDCHLCHPGTVEADNVTIAPGGLHMDGIVESTGHAPGYASPAVHGPDALAFIGGGAGNCTSCHTGYGAPAGASADTSCNGCHAGAGVDDWQTNCTFCHGTHTNGVTAAATVVAPPDSVLGTGAQDASNRRVGAHQAHLAAGAFSRAFPCSSCHTPVPTQALAHFAGWTTNASVVPAFDAFAQTGVTGAAYAGNGGTCAVYCHGSGSQFGVAGQTTRSPAWTAGAIACGDCHGTPPASGPSYPAPNAHEFHVTTLGKDCSKCHAGYTGGANPSIDATGLATHVNGTKDVVVQPTVGPAVTITGWDCNACHGALGVPLMHAQDFLADHEAAALGSISGCTDCHGASYQGTPGVPSCNDCHATNVTASAPDWKQNCSFCHGTRTADVTTAVALAAPPQSVANTGAQDHTNPKVGAHQAHLGDGTFANALACGSCHTVPPDGDLAHFTGWSAAGSVTPAFGAVATKGVASPGYAGSGGTCAVYCHGSGTEFPANAGGTVSPGWTTTGSVACGDCHGTPPDSGPTVSGANAHAFHTGQGVACATCHGAGYSTTTVAKATHVNGVKDLAVAVSGWDCAGCHSALGISHPAGYVAVHTADALAAISACTSCHGADYDGIAGFSPSCNACHADAATYPVLAPGFPDWKTNCTFCHGTRTANVTTPDAIVAPPQSVAGTGAQDSTNPKVGAHQAHLAGGLATAFTCATCHTPTPTDPLGHFAGWTSASSVTPAFSPLGTQGVASPSYTGGTCAVYCHGSGTSWPAGSVAANPTPAWTSTPGSLACNACHALRPTTGGSSGHNSSNHATTTGGAPTPCAECHLGYVQGTSVDPAYHVNGTRTVVYTNNGGGVTVVANPGWTSCGPCHSASANGNSNVPASFRFLP